MSQVFDFSGVGDFCPGGLLYPNPKRCVHLASHKRARVYNPFLISGESKRQASIDVLPEECLFEIFRRLHGGQERMACAGVSKHWLMLLSNIRSSERFTPETMQSGDKNESHGYLSRSLDGKEATDVKLAAIAVGTSSPGGLGKLAIRGDASTRGLTKAGFKAISRGCPDLKALSLCNLSIGDECLCEIASGVSSLENLDLSLCPAVTDNALVAIAMSSPNLTSVVIESCSKIGNDSLKALGSYCPNLRSVTVKNCPLVGDQGIVSLFSSAGHVITKAKFQGLNIGDVSLAVIGCHGKGLTDLALVNLQNVNERGFWVMGKAQGLLNLKYLSISACAGISDLALESISKGCPDLKTFGLKKCTLVSDDGVASFTEAAASLGALHFEECHRITQIGVFRILESCGENFKALSLVKCLGIKDLEIGFPLNFVCPSLRSLTIQNCPGFGDSGLTLLGQLCPELYHVNLTGLQGITDSGLLPLIQSSDSRLEKVNVTGCVNLTDNVVCKIVRLHGETLEVLNLDGCRNVTDRSLAATAKYCWFLSELDVSRTGVTDFGISVLAKAKHINLLVLSLGGCSLVSDKSSPFLKALGRTLVGLNVQNCRGIGSGTVDMLLEELWRCDVLY